MLTKADKKWIKDLMTDCMGNLETKIKQSQRTLINDVKIELIEIVQNELKSLVMANVWKGPTEEDEDGVIRPVKGASGKWVKVNVLYDSIQYMRGIEGALRGWQEDISKFKARIKKQGDQIKFMAGVMNVITGSLKQLAGAATKGRLVFQQTPDIKMLEHIEQKTLGEKNGMDT